MSVACNIGLEVHAQLLTQSKLFSYAPTTFGAEPNTQACEIDLGFPGVLPVLNKKAVEMAIKFGLSVQADISKHSTFARKNYFYPDLPKNYQITQHHFPIIENGSLMIPLPDETTKKISITRAHLEEDAGKSVHDLFDQKTALDFNRSGNPLLEIVSAPELHSAQEATAYLKTLHRLVRYLGICDGNMQEGSFRCDVNISIRPEHTEKLGTRVELKNINSFRFIEHAIAYELQRQHSLLEQGQAIIQETRLYDAQNNETRAIRHKENVNNYRYFSDPDLLPLNITDELIESVQKDLPELPWEKHQRFIKVYQLAPAATDHLISQSDLADFFEDTVSVSGVSPTLVANWINGELSAALNKENLPIQKTKVDAKALSSLLKRIEDKTISGKIAKEVFSDLWKGEGQGNADNIIQAKNLKQITDTSFLDKIIDETLAHNEAQIADYKAGKTQLLGYFMGQIMQATQGKANPSQIQTLLKDRLKDE